MPALNFLNKEFEGIQHGYNFIKIGIKENHARTDYSG